MSNTDEDVQPQSDEDVQPIQPGGPSLLAETTQADANPAYYPKEAKSEALYGEAEKAGLDYPGPIVEGDDEVTESPDPNIADDSGDQQPAEPAEVPARNASTAVWRDYAVNGAPADNRYTKDEADAASRD